MSKKNKERLIIIGAWLFVLITIAIYIAFIVLAVFCLIKFFKTKATVFLICSFFYASIFALINIVANLTRRR